MQQVQLADWIESGMARDPAALLDEMVEQVRRSFCRSGLAEDGRTAAAGAEGAPPGDSARTKIHGRVA
jgi:hypothetical protein